MRRVVDLRRLPAWAQYAIAVPVAALVAFLGWLVGHDKPAPAWLGPVQKGWTWIGPALLAFFIGEVARETAALIRRSNA